MTKKGAMDIEGQDVPVNRLTQRYAVFYIILSILYVGKYRVL